MTDIPTVPTPENEENTTPVIPPAPVVPPSAEPVVPEENVTDEQVASVPTQEEEAPVEKKQKKPATQVFVGLIAIVLGLVAVAYVFILWTIVEGNFNDPQFAQFLEMAGMNPVQLKEKFTLITHFLFGGVSFIFLIATLVKFFQWIMTSSSSIYKKHHLKKMGVFVFLLVLMIAIWMGVIWLVSRADAAPPMTTTKSEKLIQTQPASLYGLTAPVSVTFDIGTKLFEKIPKDLVREIRWDFDGDGETDASEAEVTHRFLDRGSNDGRYTMKVDVVYFSPNVNEERTYTETHDVVISNVAAAAVMTATPETGAVPLTVKFTAEKSTDLDGEIIQYEWDLDGDGEFEIRGVDEKEVEKIFYKIGEYQVRLRVTGQNHDFSIDEKTITVIEGEQKVRAEIVSPDSAFEGMAPLEITFDGGQSYSQSGKIVKFEWRIDGEPKPFLGRKMYRKFDTEGEYEVELLIENDSGDRDTTKQLVKVLTYREMNITTVPAKGADDIVRGKIPFEVTFDASKSEIPNAVEWKWDFETDDIVDSRKQTDSYIFRTPGEYETTLTIVDADDNEFTKTQKIVVEKVGVIANISANPSSGTVPLTVEFDGAGSQTTEGEIIDYIWTFQGETPIHYNGKIAREFRQVGVFPVKLEVLTSSGKRAEKEIFISVRGQVLQAAFETSPMAGEAPLKVRFSPTLSTGNIQSYFWTFGDGSVSVEPYPVHTFTYGGVFPVKLKITDSRGIVSTAIKDVSVTEKK